MDDLSLSEMQKSWHGSLRSYSIGLTISIVLTLFAFYLVKEQLFLKDTAILILSGSAILQAAVQMIYFLHLGREGRPYFETCTFFLMLFIFFIIVLGSLWIMYDLNMRMMPHD